MICFCIIIMGSSQRLSLLLCTVLCITLQQTCEGTGHISVKLNTYRNPGGKGDNGNCCDGLGFICRGHCDHYFTICLDNAEGSPDNMDSCALGKFVTAKTEEQDDIVFGNTIGSDPNPRVLDIQSWPGEAMLKVLVMDSDEGNDDDLVEHFDVTINLKADRSEAAAASTMMSLSHRTRLEMEVSVYCDPEWYGPACDVQCTPSDGPQGHYDCHTDGSKLCYPGWTGPKCDVNIDECGSTPCFMGGVCHDHSNGYSCVCFLGYTGKNCEFEVDECESQPCQNGGTCTAVSGGFNCSCPANYKGLQCEVGACDSAPCLNGGQCRETSTGYVCECPVDKTGALCESDIHACDMQPCKNNGICIREGASGFTCQCPSGWVGPECSDDYDDCAAKPCAAEFTCVDVVGGYECIFDNYSSDACSSSPCHNGGSCIDGDGDGYLCRCPDGFRGEHCEIPSTMCASDPCQNGGSCRATNTGFVCHCKPGFYGEQCQVITTTKVPPTKEKVARILDPCISSPCEANATCIVTNSSYQCKASCNNSLCSGGGRCVTYDGVEQCSCFSSFTGQRCETYINPCESNPCLHNGRCITHSGHIAICRCLPGFTGLRCETDINECNYMKCQHGGTCKNTFGHFFCTCPADFTGTYCESSIVYDNIYAIMSSIKIPTGKLYLRGALNQSIVNDIHVVIRDILNEENVGIDTSGIKIYDQVHACMAAVEKVSLFVYKLVLNGKAVRQELVEYVERMLHTPEVASKLPLPTATRADCEYYPQTGASSAKSNGKGQLWIYLTVFGVACVVCAVLAVFIIRDRRRHKWQCYQSQVVFKRLNEEPVLDEHSKPMIKKYRQPSDADDTVLVDMNRKSRSSSSGAAPSNYRVSSSFN